MLYNNFPMAKKKPQKNRTTSSERFRIERQGRILSVPRPNEDQNLTKEENAKDEEITQEVSDSLDGNLISKEIGENQITELKINEERDINSIDEINSESAQMRENRLFSLNCGTELEILTGKKLNIANRFIREFSEGKSNPETDAMLIKEFTYDELRDVIREGYKGMIKGIRSESFGKEY